MMAAAVGDHLREFAEIDLREEPYPCGISDSCAKPYFPKLYLNGRKDKALMTMPGSGRALVRYKVQRRNIDETREDGPRYGADIEVQSIEPVEDEMEESAELARADFCKEFGFKPRTNTQLLKTSKRNPLMIRKNEHGEFVVHPRGKVDTPGTHYADSIQDARATAASMLKKDRAQMKARGKAALSKMVDRMETGSGNRPDLTMNSRPAWTFSAAMEAREFGSAGFQRLRRAEESVAKRLKKAGADTGVHNRTLKPLYIKSGVKMESGMVRAMKRPDFGLRQNPKQRAAAIGLSAAGRLHEFMGERDRDDAGRFATGQVAKPEDFMLAQKKKPGLLKKAAAATALTGAGAGLLALKYRKR